jgi:serine/threonine protein phosphatase PrpC
MGSFLDHPIVEKDSSVGEANGLQWGVSAMQGWRVSMEDSHIHQDDLGTVAPGYGFYGVFDGHGGENCAKIVAERFVSFVTKQEGFATAAATKDIETLKKCLIQAHFELDAEMWAMPGFNSLNDRSGCTSVTALVSDTHIIVANSGDSRSVLGTNKTFRPMSFDHKPNNPGEQARIVAAGGSVQGKRVNGDLAVSRAFGDFCYKQAKVVAAKQAVTVDPDFEVHERDNTKDEFLILACDGIWDVMSNEECSSYVRGKMLEGYHDRSRICEALIDTCLEKGSKDNMSAMIVTFPAAAFGPKINPPPSNPVVKTDR